MHISSCLSPKTIRNRYTGELQKVPCGRCAACLNRKSSVWVQRLDQERQCWKYCVFFTLTYSNDFVPEMHLAGDILFSNQKDRLCHGDKLPIISLSEYSENFDFKTKNELYDYFKKNSSITFLSVSDFQKFIKRVRQSVVRLHKGSNSSGKDNKIRYFLCGEYGPTTFRAHSHGLLFFNSELTASSIEEIISKSWKFGYTDTSFVTSSASQYVAKYVNCTTHLPKIFSHPLIRPFTLCSKSPFIGSLSVNSKELWEIFDSCSPEFIIADHKQGIFENVPLWRSFVDRLYPKLSGYSSFSHYDRTLLYTVYQRLIERYEEITSSDFVRMVLDGDLPITGTIFKDYAKYLLYNSKTYSSLVRWFNISSRIYWQSKVWCISVKDYIYHIERFYDNVEKIKLKTQFDFENDYAEAYGSSSLIGLDSDLLRSLCLCSDGMLSANEIYLLESFGVDLAKFCSEDSEVRLPYQASLFPENTIDYLHFKIDNEIIFAKSSKTRKKNEFINSNIFVADSDLTKSQQDFLTFNY